MHGDLPLQKQIVMGKQRQCRRKKTIDELQSMDFGMLFSGV